MNISWESAKNMHFLMALQLLQLWMSVSSNFYKQELRLKTTKLRLIKVEDRSYIFLDRNVYLLSGLPNRSHALNSGDQLVKKSCQHHVCQRAELCLVQHCVDIVDGTIPHKTSLDMNERAVKPLICLWLSQWLGNG